ncbi:MAG: hypothetical protein O7H39_13390 [Gammaproteobacteria bacterium]|nr:hypothetical protein [Gammaproteobacteria bacterium]
MLKRILAVVIAAGLTAIVATDARVGRVALVIGNNAYGALRW